MTFKLFEFKLSDFSYEHFLGNFDETNEFVRFR